MKVCASFGELWKWFSKTRDISNYNFNSLFPLYGEYKIVNENHKIIILSH